MKKWRLRWKEDEVKGSTQEHQTKGLRKEVMEIDAKTTICICQHIKAYFRQCADNEKADWGEPCADCKYALKTCQFDWLTHLMPLFKNTGIAIRLGRAGHSDK